MEILPVGSPSFKGIMGDELGSDKINSVNLQTTNSNSEKLKNFQTNSNNFSQGQQIKSQTLDINEMPSKIKEINDFFTASKTDLEIEFDQETGLKIISIVDQGT